MSTASTITLRPYQMEAIDAVLNAFQNYNVVLLTMATGLGKTVVFSELAKIFSQHGKVMVLAHREELVFQAARHLQDLDPGIEMADERAATGIYRSPVVVGTIQTVSRQRRLAKINPHDYSLLVIDEAHHATAKTYRRVIEHFLAGSAKVLGVTATPVRSDKKSLARIFEYEAYRYTITNAIRDGWLVPVKQFFITDVHVDMSTVRVTHGDFSESDLEKIIADEKLLHAVAHVALEATKYGPVLVYTPGVQSATRCAEIINRYRPSAAEAIHASQDRIVRRGIVSAFRNSDIPILVNCMIATEGFDCPSVGTIIVARPTKSATLYTQILGRGTRPLPGLVDNVDDPAERRRRIAQSDKPCLNIVDLIPSNARVKPITSYQILCDVADYALVAKIVDEIEPTSLTGKNRDEVDDVIAQIEQLREQQKAREEIGRASIICHVNYRIKTTDPFNITGVERLIDLDGDPPTEAQLALLQRRFGIKIDPNTTTRKSVSELITKLITREKQGLATYRQLKLLVSHGMPQSVAVLLTKGEATYFISCLERGRWVRFAGVVIPKTVTELEHFRRVRYGH